MKKNTYIVFDKLQRELYLLTKIINKQKKMKIIYIYRYMTNNRKFYYLRK